jgi:transcriptional regulator with XRE-family HTH domain
MLKDREGTRTILSALKTVIKTSGLSVTEVAARAKVTRQYIYLILADRTNPTLELIERIFEACSESFGRWLNEDAAHRFKGHAAAHETLEKLLRLRGEPARTTNNLLDGLAALYLRSPNDAPQPLSKPSGQTTVPKRHEAGVKIGE